MALIVSSDRSSLFHNDALQTLFNFHSSRRHSVTITIISGMIIDLEGTFWRRHIFCSRCQRFLTKRETVTSDLSLRKLRLVAVILKWCNKLYMVTIFWEVSYLVLYTHENCDNDNFDESDDDDADYDLDDADGAADDDDDGGEKSNWYQPLTFSWRARIISSKTCLFICQRERSSSWNRWWSSWSRWWSLWKWWLPWCRMWRLCGRWWWLSWRRWWLK